MGFEIKSTKDIVDNNGVKILVYANSGFGKTSTLGTLKGKTLLLNVENGFLVLKDKDIDTIDITSISTLGEVYKALVDGSLQYDNVAIDSLSEIGEMVVSELMQDEYYGDPRNAMVLWKTYSNRMTNIVKMFRDLKGFNVIFTALVENVDANGTITKMPMIPAKKFQLKLPSLFDEVYYGVVKGDGERFLHTTDGAGYMAKSRAGTFAREVNITQDKEDATTLGAMLQAIVNN